MYIKYIDSDGYVLCYIHHNLGDLPLCFVLEDYTIYRWGQFNKIGNLNGEYIFKDDMVSIHPSLCKKSPKRRRKVKNKLIPTYIGVKEKVNTSTNNKRKRNRRGGRRNKTKKVNRTEVGKKEEIEVIDLRSPALWLCNILETNKYQVNFGVMKSINEQYDSYKKWCEEVDLVPESNIGWSRFLSSINKGINDKRIYNSKIVSVGTKKIRKFDILPEKECKDIFSLKYGIKFHL